MGWGLGGIQRMIARQDPMLSAMFHRKTLLQTLLILSCLVCEGLAADRIQLVIDEKMTLEEVFKAGFRPSAVDSSNMRDVRVWERQSLDLLFGDFRFSIDTEQTTFMVYDDDQIQSLRIIGSRETPLSFLEVEKLARGFSDQLGLEADSQIDEWLGRCRARNSMTMQGFGGKDWRPGVRVGGQFLTTLQRLDQKPAVLGIEIRWKYLGNGPAGGDRWGKPVVSPAGYDWDMSNEAWRARVRQGSSKPSEKPPVMPQQATPEASVDPSRKPRTDGLKSEIKAVPEKPRTGSPGLIILVAGLILSGVLAFLLKVRKRNPEK